MSGRTTRTPLTILVAAGLAVAATLPTSAAAQSRPVLIRAGEIHTVTNGVITNGEILLRDGVIEQVGPSVDAPAGAVEYEAEVVIPGMIDAHAHLGIDRSGRARIPGPFTAEWKAVENLNLEDPMIQVALSGGVTSVIARSGSGIISSGQSVALKMKSTPGPDMILKPYVDLKMAVRPLINLRPGETPQTVMGWYATADDYYRRARLYMEQQDAYAAGRSNEPPPVDERLEALVPVLRGDVMVHAHSHYPSEIMMVLRLARKYGFVDRLALAHAEEVFPMIDLLAGTNVIPVIGPMMIVQYYNDPEPMNLLEELLEAGITASIQTDMSNQHFKDFREYGAFLARHGLTDQQALEVMTINGAKAMMLEDRVGSIEVGKDADLVLMDGHFLDLTADRVERVFIDGELEYERGAAPQQDEPREVGPFGRLRNEIGPDDGSFAITGAHVFTVSDGAIENATIVVEEGRFTQVEAGGQVPAGMPVMEAGGRIVMPGTIIARAFANDWIGDLKWQVQNDEITEPIVPEMNALYAVDPWFPSYEVNTTVGVTSINVTPGTLNLIGGNGVVVKTPGLDFEEMVRQEPSSIVMSLTSGTTRYWAGASQIPVTLESASAMIRAALDAARAYSSERSTREYDQRHEALLPLLRREVPALIHADRVAEISEAMSLAEDYGLRLVITGGVEAYKLAGELAAADAGVILGNSGSFASDIRGGGDGWSIEGPAILSQAGVKVAFFGPGASRRASPIGRLGGEPILNSAWAFRNGVSEVEALRMATLNAAEMLDMDDRIGSIEVGKNADFVVLEGHPFDYRVVPKYVFVDGRLEAERR
jgi:imidazolonepropionase-like amidohydrolase